MLKFILGVGLGAFLMYTFPQEGTQFVAGAIEWINNMLTQVSQINFENRA